MDPFPELKTIKRSGGHWSFWGALAGMFLMVCGQAADIQVYAAASLKNVLVEVAVDYEKTHPDKLKFNLAGSNVLAQQIQEGAPADLFLSADEAKMNVLDQAKLLVPGTRRSLLTNTLVIVVEKSSSLQIKSGRDLALEKIKRLALAETQTVPAGIYAKSYLTQLGIWDQIKNRVIATENVRAALATVESGNVEAGIVYRTDALGSKEIRIAYEVPSKEGPSISYPMALVVGGKNPAGAKALLAYLTSEAGLRLFETYGFGVIR
jgi:molybdate transport system substrate-binding protein